jgi:phage terminase large subunit GpA-like protein
MDVCGDPLTRKVALMFGVAARQVADHRERDRPRDPPAAAADHRRAAEDRRGGGVVEGALRPMVEATPVLRERVRMGRSRDSENTLRFKRFDGGFLAIASANSPAELAARSCALQACDEVDRYAESAGKEGKPTLIVERRGGAIDDARQILSSTPGDETTSEIAPAFLAGDQRFFFVPCPHCAHEQTLRFHEGRDDLGKERTEMRGGLTWERDDETDRFIPGTAYYVCEESCSATIEEKWKGWMLERGRWIATNPRAAIPPST